MTRALRPPQRVFSVDPGGMSPEAPHKLLPRTQADMQIQQEETTFPSTKPCVADIWGGSTTRDIHQKIWRPESKPRGVLGIIHGIGEHSGRHDSSARFFAERGFLVSSFDIRGHGKSPGRRGHVESWEDLRSDIGTFLTSLRDREGKHPTFLYGHSLGALAALDFILKEKKEDATRPDPQSPRLLGLITSSAPLAPANIPWIKTTIAYMLGRTPILRRLHITNGIDPSTISRDPAEVQRYVDDDSNHNQVTPAMGSEFERIRIEVLGNAAALRIPILMFHGSGDQLTPVEGTKRFYENLPTDLDRDCVIIEEARHEIHHYLEAARDLMLTRWLTWMEERLRKMD